MFELSTYSDKQDDMESSVSTRVSSHQERFKRHYGNNWTFLYYKDEPLITIGPHWPLTLCMIGTFIGFSYLLIFIIAASKTPMIFWLSVIVALLQLLSYLICALKNPGIVTGKYEFKGILQCLICNNPRQIGPLYHCDDCDVCVRGYDHHCPWTGKCIGSGNIVSFYFFVTMIPIYLVYFVIISLL